MAWAYAAAAAVVLCATAAIVTAGTGGKEVNIIAETPAASVNIQLGEHGEIVSDTTAVTAIDTEESPPLSESNRLDNDNEIISDSAEQTPPYSDENDATSENSEFLWLTEAGERESLTAEEFAERVGVDIPELLYPLGENSYISEVRKYFLDISAADGDSIFAAASGTVTYADLCGGYGYTVVVQNGDFSVVYTHLSEILAAKGDAVAAGDVIGRVGSSGCATGHYLGIMLYYNSGEFECFVRLDAESF